LYPNARRGTQARYAPQSRAYSGDICIALVSVGDDDPELRSFTKELEQLTVWATDSAFASLRFNGAFVEANFLAFGARIALLALEFVVHPELGNCITPERVRVDHSIRRG
jgi:hypothetical protein